MSISNLHNPWFSTDFFVAIFNKSGLHRAHIDNFGIYWVMFCFYDLITREDAQNFMGFPEQFSIQKNLQYQSAEVISDSVSPSLRKIFI